MGRTYQQVFGVSPGSEVSEARGITYVPCGAVEALLGVLKAHKFFAGKLGGQGPVVRSDWKTGGLTHQFNRHHAGLAVDVMLSQSSDAEVALGQHLVALFEARQGVMKWRSLIYQDYTNNPGDGTKLDAACWTAGGHYDHIHIDWFSTAGVASDSAITSVPVRRASGAVADAATDKAKGLVTNIPWPAAAGANEFASDAGLVDGLADLMGRHSRGELQKGLLGAGVCQAPPGVIAADLAGRWRVTIGGWTGVFTFTAAGAVSWAEAGRGNQVQHAGNWTASASGVTWKFKDPGDIRTFTVPLPIRLSSTKGAILPAGQGWFEMAKL